jgi:hypothetical protein
MAEDTLFKVLEGRRVSLELRPPTDRNVDCRVGLIERSESDCSAVLRILRERTPAEKYGHGERKRDNLLVRVLRPHQTLPIGGEILSSNCCSTDSYHSLSTEIVFGLACCAPVNVGVSHLAISTVTFTDPVR